MAKIQYEEIGMKPETLARIGQANRIIDEYRAAGYDLTLRQLYYQFVSRDLIPNKVQEYKRLGDVVSKGRRVGLIDWDAIVDRTRNVKINSHWTTAGDIIGSALRSFQLDKRIDQPNYIEVWVEKDALVGIFEGPCFELDVPLFACRGYTSDSEAWAAAQRIRRACQPRSHNGYRRRRPYILHFGDHDPSGIDMTRDIRDRLSLFGCDLAVDRLALNMDQVEEYEPPPNPAKETDSRFQGYMERFGDKSWELDALDPRVLDQIVREKLDELTDPDKWEAKVAEEDEQKRHLRAITSNWENVCEYLDGLGSGDE